MNTINTSIYHSPCGDLLLASIGEELCMCDWIYANRQERLLNRFCKQLQAVARMQEDATLRHVAEVLDGYFQGGGGMLDCSLRFIGTDFQQQVWNRLLRIEYGETLTYSEVAKSIGNARAVRAVAAAIGANPISIFVPCHRVVGRNGSLTGYAGGLEAKRYLLGLEMRKDLLFL